MSNLQESGWILDDVKRVDLTAEETDLWRLKQGDLVFNRTNSKELVGKCEVFDLEGEWVFASYLMRLRVNESAVVPTFLRDFLSGPTGRAQIDRDSRQIVGMSNINAEEIRRLIFPKPDRATQLRLVREMDAAREGRRRRLWEADDLLRGLDGFVVDQFKLALPAELTKRDVYAVRASNSRENKRLNAEYFHPERIAAIRSIRHHFPVKSSARLEEVGEFCRDQRSVQPDDDYIGLAHVQPHTGERVANVEEEGEGACFEFQTGDVLYGRLRPYLNKVYYAEHAGVCSTEFHVIRVYRDAHGKPTVQPDYLASVLRSRIVLAQTRHMMTGNTHPRLANEDVVNLYIPVPDPSIQTAIVVEAKRRRAAARLLRDEAARLWDDAKRRFEDELLGPAGTPPRGSARRAL